MTSPVKSAFQSLKRTVSKLTPGHPTLNITFQPESRLKLLPIPTADDPVGDGDSGKNKKRNDAEFVPVYSDGSSVVGHVDIVLPDHVMEFEYDEIAVYLVGHILCEDIDHDQVFLSHKITLKRGPGVLTKNEEFDFKFAHPQLKFDSFYGTLIQCKYFVRAIINRSKLFQSNIKLDHAFLVMNVESLPAVKPVTMQVGVDDCLHIKFEYDTVNLSTHGYLSDYLCIAFGFQGTVTVLSNSLKITTMQIQLIRREMVRTAEQHKPEVIETQVMGKFEVMDGFPADGERIPVRMFLQRFKGISNTQISEAFSVRYYVNLGLIDSDGRRYFKTCEIFLFRTQIM